MAITLHKATDLYDPLHETLNRPLAEIDAALEGMEGTLRNAALWQDNHRQTFTSQPQLSEPFAPQGNPTLARRGDLASLSMTVVVATAGYLNSSTYRLVGQLPPGFRPAVGTRFVTARHNGNTGALANVEIRTGGQIYMRNCSYPNHAANLVLEFADTYVAAGDIS